MILITGATGTVGRQVVMQLSDNRVEFRAMVHRMEKAPSIALPGAHIVPGNYNMPDTLINAMQDMESLFILTESSPDQYRQETNLVDAAVITGVKHIVKLSVYGASPFSPISIGWNHWRCEKYIEESGIAFTHIRPNLFMQNMLGHADTIIPDGRFYGSAGNGRVPFIDARDIASVVVSVLTNSGHLGKSYEITGPESLSYNNIAKILTNVLGREVAYVDIPEDDLRSEMLDSGMPQWMADDYTCYQRYFRDGYGSQVTNWNARLKGDAPIHFDQFARDYFPAFTSKQVRPAA
ncbi:MAG: SDR family oxidoreductase [Armatimonadota bacterium]